MGRLSQPFYLTVIYDFQPACLRVLKCYSAVDRSSPISTQPRLPSEIRKQEKVIKNPSGDWWVALCVVVVMRGLDREMTWKSAMHFLFSLTTNLLQTTTRRVGQTEKHLSCQVSVRLSFHRDSQRDPGKFQTTSWWSNITDLAAKVCRVQFILCKLLC